LYYIDAIININRLKDINDCNEIINFITSLILIDANKYFFSHCYAYKYSKFMNIFLSMLIYIYIYIYGRT